MKTVYKWIFNNQELPKNRGGKVSKQTDELIYRLITAIEKNPLYYIARVSRIVHNEFDVFVCINTIKNWLDAKLFTVKNTRNQINNINSQENKAKRSAYIQTLYEHRSHGKR